MVQYLQEMKTLLPNNLKEDQKDYPQTRSLQHLF